MLHVFCAHSHASIYRLAALLHIFEESYSCLASDGEFRIGEEISKATLKRANLLVEYFCLHKDLQFKVIKDFVNVYIKTLL